MLQGRQVALNTVGKNTAVQPLVKQSQDSHYNQGRKSQSHGNKIICTDTLFRVGIGDNRRRAQKTRYEQTVSITRNT